MYGLAVMLYVVTQIPLKTMDTILSSRALICGQSSNVQPDNQILNSLYWMTQSFR